VREEIAKRENDMFSGISAYKQDADFAKSIKTLVAPVARELQQYGVEPQQFIGNLIGAHQFFASPQVSAEQKQAAFAKLAQDYGIQLPSGQPADPNGGEYVDPQVQGLQQQLAQLQSRLERYEGGIQQSQQAEAQRVREAKAAEIEKFANDQANPYFYDVADEITALIRGSGGQMPLQEAYEKAVWANPVTRAKEIARQQAEAVTKAKEEADRLAAEAAAARGARVRTSGHQGSGTAATGSMDDTMEATLAAIKKRG
jgi:TolA-binding protein